MKSVFVRFIIFLGLSHSAFAGEAAFLIEYSPSNPVAGQTVTFTISDNFSPCIILQLAPDAGQDPGAFIPLSDGPNNSLIGTYVYPAPGQYHVALDREDDEECINSTRTITSNKRALTQFFEMGPVGGPYTDAVFLNEIPCAPLIVGAPAPIPTLSQWVVICLAIMLSIIGVVYMINLSFNKTDS